MKLNEKALLNVQLKLAEAFRILRTIPLDQFINEMDQALSFGPFIDPTLFMKKADDGARWMRIARAFQDCRNKVKDEFKDEK